MTRFVDKAVLVTGGGGAIGSAAARRFAQEGARVAIVDLDARRAEDIASAIGNGAIAITADVSDEAAASEAVARAVKAFGRLDAVFNNAGISGKVAPVHELPTEDWDRIVRVNLRSMFLVLKASVKAMIEAGVEGSIVNMGSSMAGWDVLAGGAGYASTKHGVVGLTRVAALDAAPYGIRVNAICPGVIETTLGVPAADKAQYLAGVQRFADRIPLRRIGQPEDVAAAVAFLASDDARHVTGVDWLIDGGQTLQSWANAPEAATFPDLRRNAR
ncbi:MULTISPECIES: SDR family NAD(P)-dependent oxidoreductase [unclassified Mesorhizobium]|uniref:SDR family NAD(P)-dependent oxidoreductase n=1 Tax=unclassified Mesorhizobium TaxID=325217 RepID=UPI00095D2757|nr:MULTISPECIES: SDR family NAD(P)-dependent oxidoreductase [unclassified Mesorhizobium]MBN9257818.1 SDR family oxidoreductase [Mesorhizobium sp.]MBN9269536.1 SDR family oxidoreductase [Mesorhizobium sp.]OJX79194.1 MAG: short-chain dehydrogenase [Mesorhizobium sp. 65-26]